MLTRRSAAIVSRTGFDLKTLSVNLYHDEIDKFYVEKGRESGFYATGVGCASVSGVDVSVNPIVFYGLEHSSSGSFFTTNNYYDFIK